ncbi:MAG: tetratricopeptide repeat protein [Proteobacteria bacterium]|nr:tetratricopeptide repeat protein [Pseudomonadota bacterium]
MTQDLVSAPLSSAPISALLEDAIRLHAAGSLDQARAIYKSVLARAPRESAALHGMALIAVDEGIPDKALPFLFACLQIAPENAIYRTSLGLALTKLGKVHEAAAQFLEAANRAPNLPEPRIHLARALARMNRRADGLKILTEASELFPGRADVWIAKGQEERAQQQSAAAERSLLRARALAPNDANVLNDLGVVVRAQGRTGDAVRIYREAIAIAPNDPLTHGNLGNALTELKEMDAAEEHLRQAVALAPGSIEHRCNLAIFLTREDRPHEAVVLFRDVLMRAPGHADAWTNLGVAQLDMGEVADAEASIRKAISAAPQNAEAHYNLAWVLLLTGQWREGWREYEWRWRMRHFSSKRRVFTAPLWDGAHIAGTLLLHAEQGLGDSIQFVRYAEAAKARCGRLVVEGPKALVRLFKTIPAIDQVIAAGDTLPAFDAHAPLMSLPHIFGTTPETAPHRVPYLSAPAGLTLPKTERRRIGLVWAGSPDNKIDKRRTIPAALFAPLMEETAADFVSLQIGPKASEAAGLPQERLILACDGKVTDFADTAAVIAQLDLVVGVDTAAIHLAGALGIPVWVLIPKMPDYRWMLGRDETPWYPSMRLFRQEESGNWDEVMWRVRAALTLLQASS